MPPDVGPPPSSAPAVVTFGCFNKLAKLNPPVIALWGRLLRELPGSRLVLKARGLTDTTVRARLLALFAAEGVASARLDLEGYSAHPEYLARTTTSTSRSIRFRSRAGRRQSRRCGWGCRS